MAAERSGQLVGGRFQIETLIGHGAMARVYRAHDVERDTGVALKIMRTEVTDARTHARFTREAEVQARIDHRNVATLLATGVTHLGEPYLAVELLRGQNLRSLVKATGPIAPRRAAGLAWQALQGLAAVHACGVLHRDLKPANMMLEQEGGRDSIERLVLIDFGFASLEGGAKLTGPLMVVGSLSYIAPERLRDEQPDQRADLYAIGAILYELLTGQPPFGRGDDLELADAHLNTPPPTSPMISPALGAVIARALAKAPADRYADAAAMAIALELATRRLAT